MKRDFLEGLGLEKDVIDQIMAENGKDIETEKAKTTAKEAEVQKLQERIKEADKEIQSYKDMNVDEIQKAVETWKTKAEEHEKALTDLKHETVLKEAVRTYNTVDADVLLKLIDREAISYTDDGVIGLKEQVEPLKESKPYLFKAEDQGQDDNPSDGRFNPHTPPENQGGSISVMESTINSIFEN